MTLVANDLFIPSDGGRLRATLTLPERSEAVILFAHGSGSSRLSPRNARVARALHERGLGTLLFDLLTSEEAREDAALRSYRFDIELLAESARDGDGVAQAPTARSADFWLFRREHRRGGRARGRRASAC